MRSFLSKGAASVYARRVVPGAAVRSLAAAANAPSYEVSSIKTCASAGIDALGITGPTTIFHNQTFAEIMDHEKRNEDGVFTTTGAINVDTGKFTGRSPGDKWIVKNEGSESDANLWWGDVNQAIEPAVFDDLYAQAVAHYNSLDECFVFDGFCGANPKSRKKVRFVHELAWSHHFVTNMFIRAETAADLEDFVPDFTVINACSQVNEQWKKHNLNSEVAVAFNVEKRLAVIFGTWYGGENKKGIFSMMNYWLPLDKIMAMHCSANVGKDGDSALFFGLSGTGKTTLSADPNRFLIGDDEHGWDEDGIFNFEGGCYAKTIDLTEENEPEIFRSIKPDAMLENVWLDDGGEPDYFNTSKTQNGRVSYPIYHIDNWLPEQMAPHPDNILFLTCDAFGVLPPVSRLSPGQAMYHFLSGYTAKVAGTERGITEPVSNFSPCYGAAFLTLHPTKYADLFQEKLEAHKSTPFLVNTGWTGGAYGTGNRMSIKATRACVDAILDGSINDAEFTTDPVFGFEVPKMLAGVPADVCDPRQAWEDKDAYDTQRSKLAGMFKENYVKYTEPGMTDYTEFGPM